MAQGPAQALPGGQVTRRACRAPTTRRRAKPCADAGATAAACGRHRGRDPRPRRALRGHHRPRSARRRACPVSLVCAVIEMRVGFRNVFGHDAVADPIKGGQVTEDRYHAYPQAPQRGTRRPGRRPGAADVAGVPGSRRASSAAAGSRDRTSRSASPVLARQHQGARHARGRRPLQRQRLRRAALRGRHARARAQVATAPGPASAGVSGSSGGGGGSHASKPHGAPHVPRVYKLTREPMSGSDIKAFQDLPERSDGALGRRPADRGGQRLRSGDPHDGAPRARAASASPRRTTSTGSRRGCGSLIRHPSRRTPRQLALARTRPPVRCRRCGSATRSAAPSPAGRAAAAGRAARSAGGRYPLGVRGKLIGTPHAGTHTLGQLAVRQRRRHRHPGRDEDARAGRRQGREGPPPPAGGRALRRRPDHDPAATAATRSSTDTASRSVKVGDRVHRGDVIGTSGSANGVAHLHLGVKQGDPRQLIGQTH